MLQSRFNPYVNVYPLPLWESNFCPSYLLILAENTRTDLYRTTNNIQKRRTLTSPPGFEFTISAGGRPHTHALDCAANGIGGE